MNANSLSAIFKKPKPVLKAFRKKQNARNLSNSIDLTTSTHSVDLAGRLTKEQSSPKTLKTSVNFSGAFDLIDESVPTAKKRRTPQPRKSLKVNFSRSVNASAEESVTVPKMGYLRQLRKNAKPSKEANFSAEMSTFNDASARGVNRSASKSVENISTPHLSFSFSPSWNSSVDEPRIRRCSTPLKGTSRSKRLETNLSLIPRVLPFDNELSSSSAPSTGGRSSQDNDRSLPSSCGSASFVTKVFQGTSMDSDHENVAPVVAEKKTRGRKVDPDLKCRSVFPKLAPYCNKEFYEFFIFKMEPKYGIQTKRKVVKISEKVHALVQNIVSKKNNYHQLVHRLQTLLCRRGIIRTSYDMYWFTLKFLPRDAVIKIVPIVQPFGSPLVAEFDQQSVFEPIKMD